MSQLDDDYERRAKEWLAAQHDSDEALIALDTICRLKRERDQARSSYDFVGTLGVRYKRAKRMLKVVKRACRLHGIGQIADTLDDEFIRKGKKK